MKYIITDYPMFIGSNFYLGKDNEFHEVLWYVIQGIEKAYETKIQY